MRSGDLYVERGGGDGEGRPVLVLLHGTGGSGAAWRGLVDLLPGHWPGTWVVPDLPGHGGSARLSRYTYGNLAAAVAAVLPGDRPVHLVGHSLGGVVALTPASGWFGVRVASVVGVGIKVRWTAEELAGAAAVAAKPARAFPSRDEAAGRAVKVAGLAGLVGPESPALDPLVARDTGEDSDGGWRAAFDHTPSRSGHPTWPASSRWRRCGTCGLCWRRAGATRCRPRTSYAPWSRRR